MFGRKKRRETRVSTGNRGSLHLLWFPCDYTVSFTNARVESHGAGAAARQKSKGSLDFWMKFWTKAMGRFPSTGAGFRGFSIQKSKNPKKLAIRACDFDHAGCVVFRPPGKNPNRAPFHCLPKSWIFWIFEPRSPGNPRQYWEFGRWLSSSALGFLTPFPWIFAGVKLDETFFYNLLALPTNRNLALESFVQT